MIIYKPAAKCNGELFLPGTSLALTLSRVRSNFTLSISPFLQASNRLDPTSPLPIRGEEGFEELIISPVSLLC